LLPSFGSRKQDPCHKYRVIVGIVNHKVGNHL
jgi:hypothetical protein